MYRLSLVCLGLVLSQSVIYSSFGDEARQGFDIIASASSATAESDVVLLQTPTSEVRARSITFKNDHDRITITAHDNKLELRIGAIVIRTDELRLAGTLQFDDLQLLKLDLKPREPKPATNRSTP